MSERDERSASRGILTLLLVGGVIGLAYNQSGRSLRPPRGIPWRATRVALAPLEVAVPDSAPRREDPPTPAASLRDSTARRPAASVARAGAASPVTSPSPTRTPPVAAGAKPAEVPANSPPAIPEGPAPVEARLETVKQLFDAKAALFLDARDAEEYEGGHIPGAQRLTHNDVLVDPSRLAPLRADGRPIVAYCDGGECEASAELARLLSESGFRRVVVYTGGWPEWSAAGLPTERGAK